MTDSTVLMKVYGSSLVKTQEEEIALGKKIFELLNTYDEIVVAKNNGSMFTKILEELNNNKPAFDSGLLGSTNKTS